MFWTGHLMACFWYMAATFEDNIYDTWVGNKGVVDLVEEKKDYVYFNSCYWAFQTVSTVGYGDFTMTTNTEYFMCLIWMFFGVNFYGFIVGNVATMIAALASKE